MSYKKNSLLVVSLLNQFSKKDLKQLDQFMKSNYFYKNSETHTLYAYIRNGSVQEDFFEQFCTIHHKSRNFAYLLMHELKIAIETFMTLKELEKSPIKRQFLLLEHQWEQNLNKKIIHETFNTLEAITSYNLNDLYLKQHAYHLYQDRSYEQYSQTIESLNQFYFTHYLKNRIIYYYNSESNTPIKEKDSTIESLKAELHNYKNSYELLIYYQLYLFLMDFKPESYLKFKHLFLANFELYFSELKPIYKAIRNILYNIVNANAAHTEFFTKEIYFWMVESIEKDLLNEEGYLSALAFHNMVITGLKVKEFKWVYQNIITYTPRLAPHYQELYSNCALGYYYFYQGDLKKASYHFMLLGINEDPVILYAQIRLFQILYEREELDILKTKLNYFEQKFKKIKLNQNVSSHIKLQIQALKLLIKAHLKPKLNQPKLNAFILQTSDLLFKDWYQNACQKLN